MIELKEYIEQGIKARKDINLNELLEISKLLFARLNNGGKLIVFGNGGSAADAQHFAAEITGKFMIERKPLPAIALTTNTSLLTAIANDFAFSEIFSRQVETLANKADFVVGISTSGSSLNVLNGIAKAKQIGAYTLGLTGKDGGKLKHIADKCICVNSNLTSIIQEIHIAIIHMICLEIDRLFEMQK